MKFWVPLEETTEVPAERHFEHAEPIGEGANEAGILVDCGEVVFLPLVLYPQ